MKEYKAPRFRLKNAGYVTNIANSLNAGQLAIIRFRMQFPVLIQGLQVRNDVTALGYQTNVPLLRTDNSGVASVSVSGLTNPVTLTPTLFTFAGFNNQTNGLFFDPENLVDITGNSTDFEFAYLMQNNASFMSVGLYYYLLE